MIDSSAVRITERQEGTPAVTIATTGCLVASCVRAAEMLASMGIDADVVHFPVVKPLDRLAALSLMGRVVSVEEGLSSGGLGTAIQEVLGEAVLRIGIEDRFPKGYGTRDEMLHREGLSAEAIAARIAGG